MDDSTFDNGHNGNGRDIESLEIEAGMLQKQPNSCLGSVEYAVGPQERCQDDNCAHMSEVVCPRQFPRIGNMVVFQWTRRGDDNASIDCVIGPYWPMMLCVTYPLIAVIATFCGYYVMRGKHPIIIGIFVFGVLTTAGCLALTACSDPGILRRHREEPPEDVRGRRKWTWNDQANTFRPRGAQYCRDCNVVIEGFDHTCPWTGTGIGRKNIMYFQFFTSACCCTLIYIFIIIIIMGVSGGGAS